jgi:signal transduction histidine kinase
MGFLALDSGSQLRNVAATSDALRRASRERDALLDRLRSDFYRSATVMRDYILEGSDARAGGEKLELQRLKDRIGDTLVLYRTLVPENEWKDIQTLQEHVDAYWTGLEPALQRSRSARNESEAAYLEDTVIPRRNELVLLVKQVNELDKRNLDAAEERIMALQSRFRRRVTSISILALALGGLLAVVVLGHVRRLEQEADSRFSQIEQAQRDLSRLSERLENAQEEERRSLSRELHDDLGQSMSAMIIELGRLESTLNPAQRERLGSVHHIAEENVAKIRNMALLLRPSMLDELGLVPALRWQAREFSRRTGLPVKMIADDIVDDLPDSYRTCIYRVVQEALHNCVKHSGAADVRVAIRCQPGGLSITVQDDGVGFDPAKDRGLGLLGMAERVSRLGGKFEIRSHPGHGTVITTSFPIEIRRPVSAEAGVA